MPKQKINQFLGYTTKPDEIVGQPGIATEAINCFIHQGDIVNFPTFAELISGGSYGRAQYIPTGLYRIETVLGLREFVIRRYWSTLSPTGFSGFVLHPLLLQLVANFIPVPESDLVVNDVNKYFRQQVLVANKVGYFLGKFGGDELRYDAYTAHGLPYGVIPSQMVKFWWDQKYGQFRSDVVGVYAPYYVKHINIGANNSAGSGQSSTPLPTASYQFALSFVHHWEDLPRDKVDGNIYGTSSYMSPLNSESNITADALGTVAVSTTTGRYFKFSAYLHPLVRLKVNKNGGIIVGVYVRKSTESHYDFLGYCETTDVNIAGPNGITTTYGAEGTGTAFTSYYNLPANTQNLNVWTFGIDLNGLTPNVTKDVPLTGSTGPIAGSNNVPKPSFHATTFKGRTYYGNIGSNILEYSKRTPLGVEDTGIYNQYIEGYEPIGDQGNITGIVEFLGQLIIFKDSKTYVLTGDIADKDTRLRVLFDDIGCQNDGESKSYLVFRDVLYWVYRHAYYKYSGDARPVPITDIIEKEVDVYDNKIMMLSVNERYGLIYFNETPHDTFITTKHALVYNHNNGTWTKSSVPVYTFVRLQNKFLMAQTNYSIHYVVDIDAIQIQGILSGAEFVFPLDSVWRSSEYDFTELGRLKWWKHVRFIYEIVNKPPDYQNLPETAQKFINIYDEGKELLVTKNLSEVGNLVKVGRHTDKITVEFKITYPESVWTLYPFRVREFQLEATVRGRR